jgi:hypothetical protein
VTIASPEQTLTYFARSCSAWQHQALSANLRLKSFSHPLYRRNSMASQVPMIMLKKVSEFPDLLLNQVLFTLKFARQPQVFIPART